MIPYIGMQISAWAHWSRSRTSDGLGYPSTSPMFRGASFGGAYGSKEPVGVAIGDMSEIRDMDAAIKRLSNEKKAFVVEFYVIGGKSDEIAKRIGISKKRMYEDLHALHFNIQGLLLDVAAGI